MRRALSIKRLGIGTGGVLGATITAPLIAVMYFGDAWLGLPFVPYDLFDWITRVLPGPVITFGIDLMIDAMILFGISVADAAKTAEQIAAIIQFFAVGTVVCAAAFVLLRSRAIKGSLVDDLVVGAVLGLPMAAISVSFTQSTVHASLIILWLAALFAAWAMAFGHGYRKLGQVAADTGEAEVAGLPPHPITRRQFVVRLGGAAATITILGSTAGMLLNAAERRRLEDELASTMAHLTEGSTRSPFPNANSPVAPAPGTRPEYTPLKDHYKVFIRVEPTVIDGATWVLPVMGMVDNPLRLTVDDIRNNYEPQSHYVTLRCISGRVGTTLISTTQWTGVSAQKLLADVQVQEGARYLHITSGDGYYETVDLDLIASDERIMFCYEWDGVPLPKDNGFPLRIWIPDRYGMKQPKWITGIDVTDEYKPGYWVERNWDEVAQVKATSVVDTIAANAAHESGGRMLVPVGGIAYAGARGISNVQVRVDGGEWTDAMLRDPLSETTWVIWRYDWPFTPGSHTFEVRCREGDGTPQIEASSDNRPSGASGIHSKDATL